MPSAMPAPALPSATVLLVRDEPAFEVLMVQRHHRIEFAAGALVFPGGKVEPGDGEAEWAPLAAGWDGLSPAERGFRVCAVREAFEESGLLLARRPEGGPPALGAIPAEARARIAKGGGACREFVAEHGLRLDLSAMTLFAHWVTPAMMPKRFDTRFYLMDAPDEQLAVSDGGETVDAVWIAPGSALRLGETGERTILFPTRLNLQLLAESASAREAIAAAARRRIVPVEPTASRGEEGLLVTIPADAGYGVVPPQRL